MPFPLDETISAGQAGHLSDHQDLHKLLNNNVRSVSGTTDTLVLDDFGKTVETTNSSAVTVTVPPNSSVAFPTRTIVEVVQIGTGIVTVAQGAGVTINTPGTLVLRAQYSSVTLTKRATDTWILAGDTS